MKMFKFNIKREAKIAGGLALVLFLIAFSERRQSEVTIADIQIRLLNLSDNHFMDNKDVIKLMQTDQEMLRGASLDQLNLRELESRLRSNQYVSEAEIYNDLRGNLVVMVELRRPLARIVRPDGPDGYVATDGTLMPVSEKFTPRVVLLSGPYMKKLLLHKNVDETEQGAGLMEMLEMIHDDPFWRAQVTQLDVDAAGKVTIIPQVGNEQIEFGKPEKLEEKFRKLRIYYKEILPRMGWNKYRRVNLEYDGQVVAE